MAREAEAGDLHAPGAHSCLLTPVAAPFNFVLRWGWGVPRGEATSEPPPEPAFCLQIRTAA